MSKIWYCVNCGYEVTSRGRCHLCKQKLLASPLPQLEFGDEENEVGYRLDDWADLTRGKLIRSLVEHGILHRFEDDELVVSTDDEDEVDELVAQAAEVTEQDFADIHLVEDVFAADTDHRETYVPGIGLVDAEGKPIGERGRPHQAISVLDRDEIAELLGGVRRLHSAARRLRVNPTDMEADADVAEASASAFITDQFPGLSTDTWAAVGRTTRRLLGALGSDEALEDEISRQAGILTVLLDQIAEERAEAEAAAEEAAAAEAGQGEESDEASGAAEDEESDDADDADHVEGAGEGGADGADGEDEADETDEAEGAGDLYDGGEPDRAVSTEEETVYELPTQWLPEQRAELAMLLEQGGIEATWDRGDLIVSATRENEVEALFDQIHGGQNSEAQDEAQYQEISELFAATSRLAGDPGDLARATEVLRTVHAVEGSTPFGFDGVKWSAIRKRAHLLADSIEGKAQRDVVAAEAGTLRDLLRELV